MEGVGVVYIQGLCLCYGISDVRSLNNKFSLTIWPALVTEMSVESVRMEVGDVLFCHSNT